MRKHYTPEEFHIPAMVMLDENLQPLDSKVYAVIHWFELMEKGICIASNKTIAETINTTAATVANSISRLMTEGYITGKYDDLNGVKREYLITMIHLFKTSSNDEGGVHQMMKGGSSNDEQNILNINNKNSNSTHVKTSESENPEAQAATAKQAELRRQVQEVYELYLLRFKVDGDLNHVTQDKLIERARKRYKLTPDRRAAIKRRLKDSGSIMLKAAIMGYSRDTFYTGSGNRGWIANLEFICKSYENVEKGANLYEHQQQRGTVDTDDAWAGLR